jgi:hypothetical protein
MKSFNRFVIAITMLLFTSPLLSQGLGIGTVNPDYPLHIRCGEYNGATQGINAQYPNNGILIQKDAGISGATLYLEYLLGSGRRWGLTSGGPNNLAGAGNFTISDMNAGLDRLMIRGGTGEIGIGTVNPSAQLHTTSSVRFQGLTSSGSLTDVLVRDADGNLFYRNASSVFGAGSGWLLTGNAISGSEFLGTTNNNDLRFRTNNVQKMVLTSTGNLGLGIANPTNAAEIFFGDDPIVGNNGLLLSNSGTHGATLFLTNTNTGGRKWGLASTGNSNAGGEGNLAIADITGSFNAAVIEGGSGNFGINVNDPDAKLHVSGTVRFENLPSGSGNALVVDANGDVKVSQSILLRNVQYEQEIKELKEQVAFLMKELTGKNLINGKTMAYLEQNSPNPFSSATIIRYYLPSIFATANLRITDLSGNVVKNIQVPGHGSQTITITANELTNGVYIYSLVTGNEVLDSKKMILTR